MSAEELKGAKRGAFDDKIWFSQHPLRNLRIRLPFDDENENEFRTLGDHDKDRRRIISFRHPMGIMPIPFLAFSDEEIMNTDEVLQPIFDDMMQEAARNYGIDTPLRRR